MLLKSDYVDFSNIYYYTINNCYAHREITNIQLIQLPLLPRVMANREKVNNSTSSRTAEMYRTCG
jgi:hypothetical protein